MKPAAYRIETPGEQPREFASASAAASWLCSQMTAAQLQYFRVVAVYRSLRDARGIQPEGEPGTNAVQPGRAKL